MLVGSGANLKLTPPEGFGFPSIGTNTIHFYDGWKATYYTAVDAIVMREYGKAIYEKYKDTPKFVPFPNLDQWQGDNFFRFYHRPGSLWPRCQQSLWPSGLLTEQGITYSNISHVALQILYYMGFTTILIIGMEHKRFKQQEHFWGCVQGDPIHPPEQWFEGYKVLVDGMAENGVKILNISENTHVPANIIPQDDWRNWL